MDHTNQHEVSRRDALIRAALGAAGAGAAAFLLSGCGSNQKTAGALPGVSWPDDGLGRPVPAPAPKPKAPATRPAPTPNIPGGVIARAEWARGAPIPGRMTPAKPYYRITIHHDGMDTFTSTDRGSAAARLEQIRNAHLNRAGEPFGDIGYHYVIDPAGRVWQGRPLEWQGAHVRATNEGNLGICCLGNFMKQHPSDAQLRALDSFVASQMARYRVPPNRLYTHRELGSTECPGNNLQPYVVRSRSAGAMARA